MGIADERITLTSQQIESIGREFPDDTVEVVTLTKDRAGTPIPTRVVYVSSYQHEGKAKVFRADGTDAAVVSEGSE